MSDAEVEPPGDGAPVLRERAIQRARRLEAVGRVAGAVAHDFNNFLTSIIGITEMVRASLHQGDPRRDDLAIVLDTARAAAELTGQLLAFARRQPVLPTNTDLNETVRRVAKLMQHSGGQHVTQRLELSAEPLVVPLARGQLEQILLNLIHNAHDAMPDGGTLEIRTAAVVGAAGEEVVSLVVRDDGAGIDPEALPHVLEPYFTTKGDAGTGLGLSTCYGMVKQAGGDLHLDTEVGVGTTCTISLPRLDQAPCQPRPAHTVGETVTGTLLLVDDEPLILGLMRRTLEAEGHEVLTASSEQDAVALADQRAQIDLLIADVGLRGGNGVALGLELRKRWPQLALLFCSGYFDETLEPPSERCELLSKPFEPQALLLAVQRLLVR